MKKIFSYSKDRPFYLNVIFCILCFLGLFLFSSIVYLLLKPIIHNENVITIIANLLFCLFLYLLYFKDLNKEFKDYFKDFKSNFKLSLKYYALGIMGMVFFNIIIMIFLKDVSQNENQVRELLFSSPFYTMISISILAPLSEELIFRKSLQPVIKNKWIYVITCGVLFGGAHILTNVISNTFVLTDLFYILPYGSLGASFALMDNETKTTFSSIMIHALHNTCTALLLLAMYFGGNL